ncbi:MAG TPA: hypothetical protein VMT81_01840 [Candidatus Paceibacterota bacterium]|nr:hypothetical protein [Candidatus Paceibacterota bacterium]
MLRQPSSGQTIVETVVALAAVTVGLLGILGLLSQSIFISKNVSTDTTATYLAAEGIEIAHNLVYHDVYENLAGFGTGWGTCFLQGTHQDEIDYTTTNCPAIHSYSASDPDYLEYNPTLHRYLYQYDDTTGGGSPTIFTRDITVSQNSVTAPIVVRSTVWWNIGLPTQQSIMLEDTFYNWHPAP